MIAFGLCHVFYITAVVTYAPVGWLAWLLWVILGTVIAYLVVVRTGAPAILRRAAFGYALLLSSTAGVTTGLALQRPIFTGLALGGVLFLISDTFIAIDLYNKHRLPAISSLIWLTYGLRER
ncbi:MAG: lysoplasmalogenase family protein [Caldilineaceae bacterium]